MHNSFEVRSKKSLLALGANETYRLIYLYDDNIIWDNTIPGTTVPPLQLSSVALENALFTVSPVNGCLLFGACDEQWKKVTGANLFLTYGMYSYLPTLPDPYIANLGALLRQFEQGRDPATGGIANRTPWLWLICNILYQPSAGALDTVTVGFHFGEIPSGQAGATQAINQTAVGNNASLNKSHVSEMFAVKTGAATPNTTSFSHPSNTAFAAMATIPIPDYQEQWDSRFGALNDDAFALLDVSSNANQLGVSFGLYGRRGIAFIKTGDIVATGENTATVAGTTFPFIVDGMEVKAQGQSVRAFMEPQVAWEPVFNLSAPDHANPLDPNSAKLPMDPEAGFKYFANDGGATRIYNNSTTPVALAPVPLVSFLMDYYKNNAQSILASTLTLPFGLRALAYITKNSSLLVSDTAVQPRQTSAPDLENTQPEFRDDLKGGIQITVFSGNFSKVVTDPADVDSPMLPGYTLQINNMLETDGTAKGASNLGQRVNRHFQQ